MRAVLRPEATSSSLQAKRRAHRGKSSGSKTEVILTAAMSMRRAAESGYGTTVNNVSRSDHYNGRERSAVKQLTLAQRAVHSPSLRVMLAPSIAPWSSLPRASAVIKTILCEYDKITGNL